MLQNLGLIIIFFGAIASIFSIFTTFFKMNNFYEKQHTSGINDSFAIPLIILGSGILGSGIFSISFLFFLQSSFALFFFIITSATSCHCISNAYYQENLKNKKTQNII